MASRFSTRNRSTINVKDKMGKNDEDHSQEETNKLRWATMFGRLQSYKRRHGNCLVPEHYPDDPQLGHWVSAQRLKDFNIAKDRMIQFQSVGFSSWNAREASWNDMFERLKAYKAEHGDCLVPYPYHKDSALGLWVARQRTDKHILPSHKFQKLHSIGFVWKVHITRWDAMFERLSKYHEVHGHSSVLVKGNKDDPQLGSWVDTQRKYRKASKLSQIQIKKLESLDFVWQQKSTHVDWNTMFDQLLEWKQKHGHCKVPFRNAENTKLGYWVRTQRQQRKKSKLNSEQISKLESIGFLWCIYAKPKKNI